MAEMTFVESVKICFRKYAEFRGRASRSEYWWFSLFLLLLYVVAAVLGNRILIAASLGTILPAISVFVRRLHDVGRSGWWYWIYLVPLVGTIVLLVWCCKKGTVGPNDYGPDPFSPAASDLS